MDSVCPLSWHPAPAEGPGVGGCHEEIHGALQTLLEEQLSRQAVILKSIEELEVQQKRCAEETTQAVRQLLCQQQLQLQVLLREELRRSGGSISSDSSEHGPKLLRTAQMDSAGKDDPLDAVGWPPTVVQAERDTPRSTLHSRRKKRSKPRGVRKLFSNQTANDEAWVKRQRSSIHKEIEAISDYRERIARKLIPSHPNRVSRTNFFQVPRTRLFQAVNSHLFAHLSAALIFGNVIFVGYQSDLSMRLAMRMPPQGDPPWVRVINLAFSGFFMFELVLRLLVFRLEFFIGPDWHFNIIDGLVVVVSAAFEMVSYENSWVSVLRGGSRVARMVQAVRMSRGLTSLRMMFCSLFHSLPVLFWSVVLLILVQYFFTVIFMQAASAHLRDASVQEDAPAHHNAALRRMYGSFYCTMFYLFMAVTGGEDWAKMEEAMTDISPVYGMCFVFYVYFMNFGLINILIGVFVDKAFETSSLDIDLVIQGEQDKKRMFIREVRDLFMAVDKSKTGVISRDSFLTCVNDDRVLSYLQMQQLDSINPKMLFHLLDADDSGEVDLSELIMGIVRLGGQAKSADLMMLSRSHKRLERWMKASMEEVNERLDVLGPRTSGKGPSLQEPLLPARPLPLGSAASAPLQPAPGRSDEDGSLTEGSTCGCEQVPVAGCGVLPLVREAHGTEEAGVLPLVRERSSRSSKSSEVYL